jgi:hypothetical protein
MIFLLKDIGVKQIIPGVRDYKNLDCGPDILRQNQTPAIALFLHAGRHQKKGVMPESYNMGGPTISAFLVRGYWRMHMGSLSVPL